MMWQTPACLGRVPLLIVWTGRLLLMSGCRCLRLTLLVLLGLHAVMGLPAHAAQELRTVAEESGFTRTSTSEQAHAFLAAVVERATAVAPELQGRLSLETIGHSVEGRPLGVVRLAPAANSGAEPLRVLIIANIHAGECDGKEAMLALLRDLAETPEHRFYRQPLELVILPNYNPDGNDRIGPDHRPGQVGPEIMGVRENAQQLDLNRDFMKLEAPETQALIAFAKRKEEDEELRKAAWRGLRRARRYAARANREVAS